MISKKETKIIKNGFKEIFWAAGGKIHCLNDRDGRCLHVGTIVPAIHDEQFEFLKKLTDKIPHPFAIEHRENGIRIFFFSTDKNS